MSHLPKNELGSTGISVTRLGYGSMGLRGPKTWGVRVVDEAHAEKILNLVLDSGINFIDTSPDYGIAEERIGRYISKRRDEYFLATKCGCVYTQYDDRLEIDHQWNSDIIKANLDLSLQRMRTDCIDLLQFHGGDAETLQREGLIDLLQQFRDEGLIRFIGVSSKLPAIADLIELGVFDCIQMPFSCLAPEHGPVMQRASDHGIGVIIRGGIAHGGPDAEIQRDAFNSVYDALALDELRDDSMTRAELILRYTLSFSACHTTIVGTCDEQHLSENLRSAMAGPLPSDLKNEIDRRIERHRNG